MKIPTECTLHDVDSGLKCTSDAVEWFAWSTPSLGSEQFYCRCEQHVGVRLSLVDATVFTSYDDAVVYQAMREL
jgi:hypothetical protein